MPYIKQELRDLIDDDIYQLIDAISAKIDGDELEGVMNYTLTKIMLGCFQNKFRDLRYKHINAILGVLQCMSLEMYRRVAVWYEELAAMKNRDVPELERWGSWV